MRANSTQHCEYRPHGGLQQRAPETGPYSDSFRNESSRCGR